MRCFATATLVAAISLAIAADEKKIEAVSLFDGKTTDGWLVNKTSGPVPSTNVVEGSLNPYKAGGGLIYTKERYADFVLTCDFKMSKGCNSGIFIRTANPKDEVQTGMEIQVLDSAGKAKMDKHDCGALYDLVAPSKNAAKPAGEWNHIEITAKKNVIKVVLNGEEVVNADLDKYTEAGKSPDGTKNKYKTAYKDMAREGHIGLQDHNSECLYKNISIRVLK